MALLAWEGLSFEDSKVSQAICWLGSREFDFQSTAWFDGGGQ